MSNPPLPDPLNYHSPTARISSLALSSMILGILSIPLGVVVIGFFLGFVAIILGAITLGKINRDPEHIGGKGLAVTGITTGIFGLLLTPVFIELLPSQGSNHVLSPRSTCAANLRGIAQSMVVYSNDNADAYPIIKPPAANDPYTIGVSSILGSTNPDVTITKSMYEGPGANNPLQNLWILVLKGQVSPKQFICKTDPAPTMVASAASSTGQFFTAFNNGKTQNNFSCSYSFAYPLDRDGKIGGWWRNQTDASLPLMADICPTGKGVTTSNPKLRTANSNNHQQDGQTVGYGDGHAEFARRADIGQANDNIYTSNAGTPSDTGTPYSGSASLTVGGGAGAYDICLVPCADITTGTRK